MNDIWSKYVQGTKTLYYSRKLRFDDMFAEQYKRLFAVNENMNIKILEIGCGPGALAGALHRWYPNAEITAIDRDSEFIGFAKKHVSEHIETSIFYSEQFRVLKTNGICLVLSSRKGIRAISSCISYNEYEKQFWEKAEQYDNPKFSDALAHDIINAERYTDIDAIDSALYTMPEYFTVQETEEMKRLVNAKYDNHILMEENDHDRRINKRNGRTD